MKARVSFYFAAVVALVLSLASVPSHATERRDPLLIQDTPQTQAAKSSSVVRSASLAARPAQSRLRKPKSTTAANGKSHESVNSVDEAKEKSAANTKASSSSKNAGATDNAGGSNTESE